jgi:hypothetical protein
MRCGVASSNLLNDFRGVGYNFAVQMQCSGVWTGVVVAPDFLVGDVVSSSHFWVCAC